MTKEDIVNFIMSFDNDNAELSLSAYQVKLLKEYIIEAARLANQKTLIRVK